MRRFTYPLIATTAAALLFAGASAASASTVNTPSTTGATIATKTQAGYQTSGRDFRYIESTLTVPDDSLSPFDGDFYPVEYLQLSNGTQLSTAPILGSGDQYIRAGIVPCAVANHIHGSTVCPNGDWSAFVTTFANTLPPPSSPVQFFNLAGVVAGDGVQFSIYYDQAGGDLHFVINPPNASGSEPSFTFLQTAPGAVFDHAAALDDWTNSAGGTPVALPIVAPFQIGSFLGGALTTYNGTKGSFKGAWTTSEVEATSNGLVYPSGTVRAYPTALYGDGIKANGAVRASDAFDEYLR